MKNKNKFFKFLFVSPVVIYSILLIFLPLVYIFIISFFKSDGYGGMIETITFDNYLQLIPYHEVALLAHHQWKKLKKNVKKKKSV